MVTHQACNSKGNFAYNAYIYENIFWDFHFHINYEVIYVMSGRVHCTVNGIEKTLTKGEFALCLSNEVHRYESDGDSVAFVAVFSPDYVKFFDRAVSEKIGTDYSFFCSQATVNYLNEYMFNCDCTDKYRLKSCLYAICSEYFEKIKLEKRKDKKYTLMNEITEYINNNYKQKVTLSSLAESLGYDYCYLSKIFHSCFKMSFTDYMNTYRCNEAAYLLFESKLSISDVAFESGFQSIRSFNDVFKSKYGLTPMQYRKSQ